jgi:hypothetical protein
VHSRRSGDRHHHHACRCGYCQQSQVSPTYSHHVFPRPEVGQLDSPAPLCRQTGTCLEVDYRVVAGSMARRGADVVVDSGGCGQRSWGCCCWGRETT